MTYAPNVPSIDAIRNALEEIPGALRDDEPLPESAGGGNDPANEIWISNPDSGARSFDVPSAAPEDSQEAQLSDAPSVIFEVPPELTDADIVHVLGEDRSHSLDRKQQIWGIDALGWYVTFHQRRYQYGVHIPLEGVLLLTIQAFAELAVPLQRRIELAFHAILRHEVFHFEADCMMANWELATGVDVYWNGRGHRNDAGYIEQEEALANAYMLRGFKHPTKLLTNSGGTFRALRGFCKRQPVGYSDGPDYARTRLKYFDECRWLSSMFHAVSGTNWEAPHEFDPLLLYPSPFRTDWTRCPILLLDRHDLLQQLGIRVAYFNQVADLEETPAFLRAFKKLDKSIQKCWQATKFDLERSTRLKSLDFKQWPKAGPDYYSVRLNGNYRAHLRYDRERSVWLAESVGDHKKMKHG